MTKANPTRVARGGKFGGWIPGSFSLHRAPVPSPDDEPFGDDVPQPVPVQEPVPDPNPEIFLV